jgi:hypothetical protein
MGLCIVFLQVFLLSKKMLLIFLVHKLLSSFVKTINWFRGRGQAADGGI